MASRDPKTSTQRAFIVTEGSSTAASESLTCFVIGPIGNRHSALNSEERRTYEEALQVFEEVILPACGSVGLEPVRADGLLRAGEITEQVFRRLRDDDVVIADVTGANGNVMYELGLRHTKDKITVQIGEYGRLLFDVSVIRTIMFSRSPHALISARNELIEILQTALAGEFDPVTSTRVWNETTDERTSEATGEPGPREPGHGLDEDDEPGFVDLIAAAEDQYEALNAESVAIAEASEKLNEATVSATEQLGQSDAQGRGMKGRLAVAVNYANALSGVAEELEQHVERYSEAIAVVSAGTLAIIGVLEENPDQLEEAREFGFSTRRLASTARETVSSLGELVEILRDTARVSRVLREPTRRITAALERYADENARIDEWDRRLQALGVPIPPPEWQPTEDGDTTTHVSSVDT